MSATNTVNGLIARLPLIQRKQFFSAGEFVDLEVAMTLCEFDERIRYVYFPSNGFVSMVASVSGHPPLGVDLIGNEGMIGASLILGVDRSPGSGIVQGAGTALKLEASVFRRALNDSESLRQIVGRYLYVLLVQSSISAACTHFHEVEPRLARCLRAIQDRASSSQFRITHQCLSDMLGVQRRAVTTAAGSLKHQGLISYSRGDIKVADRRGLEAAACECYKIASGQYRSIFKPALTA